MKKENFHVVGVNTGDASMNITNVAAYKLKIILTVKMYKYILKPFSSDIIYTFVQRSPLGTDVPS